MLTKLNVIFSPLSKDQIQSKVDGVAEIWQISQHLRLLKSGV